MTPLIIVALGLLGTIVMASLLALLLLFLCTKRKCGKVDLVTGHVKTQYQYVQRLLSIVSVEECASHVYVERFRKCKT